MIGTVMEDMLSTNVARLSFSVMTKVDGSGVS